MITLELSEPEFQALSGLIDAGARALGMRALRPEAAELVGKMEVAFAASLQPPAKPDEQGADAPS